jgi:HJR/Mrr/RecB family endonuclease
LRRQKSSTCEGILQHLGCLKSYEETIIFIEALTAIFSFIYPFWPVVVFLGVRPLRETNRPFFGRLPYAVGQIFIGWLVWASMWGFLHWQSRQPILILPEKVNHLAFLMVGAVSGTISLVWILIRWQEGRRLLARARKLEDLKAFSPDDFEALVAKLFEAYGHKVEPVGGNADHGVDILVMNGQGEKWVVQCKRYSGSVGEPVVRDLYGTMLHEEAQGAYLVTTGTFTRRAQQWAAEKPIILYDGESLIELIHKTKADRSTIN